MPSEHASVLAATLQHVASADAGAATAFALGQVDRGDAEPEADVINGAFERTSLPPGDGDMHWVVSALHAGGSWH